jgi:hypothetical protein
VNVFDLRDRLVEDYADFTRSFVVIRDERISARVEEELAAGLLWPDPIVQLNPAFEPGRTIDGLVDEGVLHEPCRQIFRRDKSAESPDGQPLRLHHSRGGGPPHGRHVRAWRRTPKSRKRWRFAPRSRRAGSPALLAQRVGCKYSIGEGPRLLRRL